MATQPGNPDDLIAELARLMARSSRDQEAEMSDSAADGPVAPSEAAAAVSEPSTPSNPSASAADAEAARPAEEQAGETAMPRPAIRIPGMYASEERAARPLKLDLGTTPNVDPVVLQPMRWTSSPSEPDEPEAMPELEPAPGPQAEVEARTEHVDEAPEAPVAEAGAPTPEADEPAIADEERPLENELPPEPSSPPPERFAIRIPGGFGPLEDAPPVAPTTEETAEDAAAPPPDDRAEEVNPPPAQVAVAGPPEDAPAAEDNEEATAARSSEPEHEEVSMPRAPTPHIDDFHFDFGLDRKIEPRMTEPAGAEAAPQAEEGVPGPAESQARSAETVVDDEHDAIADLIAAELEAAQREQALRRAESPEPQHSSAPPAPPRHPGLPAAPAARPDSGSDRFATAPVFGLPSRPQNMSAPARPDPDLDPMEEIERLIGASMRAEASPQSTSRTSGQSSSPAHAPAIAAPAQRQGLPAPQASPPVPAGLRPASPAPRAHPAPEAEAEAAPESKPAPVVPPMTTQQFAPRRTGLREVEPEPMTPEEAILAAAGAAGASVDHVDYPEREEPAPRRQRGRPPVRRTGGLAARASALVLALVLLVGAGFSLYWVLTMGGSQGPAPVLTADPSPVKAPPPPDDPTPSEATRSAVMAQIDGSKPAATASEQIVSRDQSAGTDVASLASDNTGAGLANRKVRTVTVRPDGTIVSNTDTVAGAEALPVDRPKVPPVPGAEEPPPATAEIATNDEAGDASPSEPATGSVPSTPIELASDQVPGLSDNTSLTDAPATPATAEAPPPPVPAPAPAELAAADTATSSPAVDAPIPMPRLNRPAQAPAVTEVAANSPANAVVGDSSGAIDLLGDGGSASTQPPPAAATASTSTEGASGLPTGPTVASAYVQIASRSTMEAATASMNTLLGQYGNLFGGATPEIVKADLGSRGVHYRVRIPAPSMEEASRICASMKAKGGDCFATGG